MKFLKTVFIITLLLGATFSSADCVYEGKSYPEGTKIGPYVCSDGKWILG